MPIFIKASIQIINGSFVFPSFRMFEKSVLPIFLLKRISLVEFISAILSLLNMDVNAGFKNDMFLLNSTHSSGFLKIPKFIIRSFYMRLKNWRYEFFSNDVFTNLVCPPTSYQFSKNFPISKPFPEQTFFKTISL